MIFSEDFYIKVNGKCITSTHMYEVLPIFQTFRKLTVIKEEIILN